MANQANRKQYSRILDEDFPRELTIGLRDERGEQQLVYEKVVWTIDKDTRGLRYGENPDQPAALYRLVNGNLTLGELSSIQPGRYLASEAELLQSGKHPGKINITDVDNALNILRYFTDSPAAVIVKHNNPCGAALDGSLETAYRKALMADRIAAFGGAVVVNRPLDPATAGAICESYCEVVAAPEFEAGVMELFAKKKNLRVMRIGNISRLQQYVGARVLDFKSLMDGGIVLQWSFMPKPILPEELKPAESEYKGHSYSVRRAPTAAEKQDMIFGWYLESGITSNSVIYVKDGVSVGIGTGEQDRVGVAEIARDKAYRKLEDRICWERHATPFALLENSSVKEAIRDEVRTLHGGLEGAVMVSDAFFPFRDGAEVGLKEGVSAIIQPGGSLRDFETIEAVNEYGATMVYTGQRSFRH
ncbi:IMP cyclohydrolase [Marispirochaeta sp.]|uniref:IMP cyclohydrolase n=1 Tax=Marispirochaeta sp. TaxID=2038653 RepID=UPI0029C6C712|nr:IMP cyclohydrolase [Marispirochaeta sp.]